MSQVQQLADRFGTPLYIYDLDRVAAARRDLFQSLPAEFDLYYALKANPHPDVVRATRDGDGPRCRAEISSTGELAAALEAGFDGADCLYTGPGKTHAELDEALRLGVRLFSTESLTDLRHVGDAARRLGVEARCLLRVNSASASAATSIRMTGAPSQFGFDAETLGDLADELRAVPGARVVGFHFFPLSNAQDEDALIGEFQHTIRTAAQLAKETGVELEYLDIGGGFAAPYAVAGERPRYPRLRAALETTLDTELPTWRGDIKVACESGRHLVGDSGTLVLGVVNTKTSRGRNFVIVDAGINAFGGLSGLGRLLPVAVAPQGDTPATEVASLVGPLCTPGDLLGRDIAVPPLAADDRVVLGNVGAYGVSASLLMFLGRPAPTEVAVRGERIVSVSRITHRREHTPVTDPHTSSQGAPA
ncbi:type III PLP-dependent enzyme [Streptomyces sp. DSM 44915]|uniref:Type III PLP-dependent enzyme n=1 Tax=Streptomyces chisholmiae TaxID=3075540 RepID=A0ABU2JWC6_9ACTN|nr:type III PLP-dependent enzyme [Streptomyces sp. DSM 44915]MDT0269264.1 type III PLP-dependent enzyme [Streptomyces sp. DSM 44915]